jgi:hypothetical protein
MRILDIREPFELPFAQSAAHVNDLQSATYDSSLTASGLSLTLHPHVLDPQLRRPLSFLFELFRDPQVTEPIIVYSVLE